MCNKNKYQNRFRSHSSKWQHKAEKFEKWAKMKHEAKLRYRSGMKAPANVVEFDDSYELHIAAPGLEKKDFSISVVNRLLRIEAGKKENEVKEGGRKKREEFTLGGFTREFELSEAANTEAIKATYKNGILKIHIAKLETAHTVREDILIS